MAHENAVVIVAAHPDDEVIGAGVWMARQREAKDIVIVHLTDGSPRDLSFARNAGFDDPAAYAKARRGELQEAVALAGVSAGQCRECGVKDLEAIMNAAPLIDALGLIFEEVQPASVITHPYEGGHPDHDTASFCVKRAVTAMPAHAPRILEFTSYHAGPNGGMQTGEFLPGTPAASEVLTLRDEERALKQRMFDCFPSQKGVLQQFRLDREMFRPAPAYDYAQPPHSGPLYYEQRGWFNGDDWRAHARKAKSRS